MEFGMDCLPLARQIRITSPGTPSGRPLLFGERLPISISGFDGYKRGRANTKGKEATNEVTKQNFVTS